MSYARDRVEAVRSVVAVVHTLRYAAHAAGSDHHHAGEVIEHTTETYAGLRKFDKKTHQAKRRSPLGIAVWARR